MEGGWRRDGGRMEERWREDGGGMEGEEKREEEMNDGVKDLQNLRRRQSHLQCLLDDVSPHPPGAIHQHHLLKYTPHLGNKMAVGGRGRGGGEGRGGGGERRGGEEEGEEVGGEGERGRGRRWE